MTLLATINARRIRRGKGFLSFSGGGEKVLTASAGRSISDRKVGRLADLN
jgi:hypothetical protein